MNEKILAGRKAVDAYREAHRLLHSKPWHRGIPEEHTPLLEKLVADLEGIGITSAELDFEPKKTEILAKFWADSDSLNLQKLDFASREDFDVKVKEDSTSYIEIDSETKEEVEVIELTPEGKASLNSLKEMWQ